MSHSERKSMVNCDQGGLSIAKQCKVLRISRSSFYYQPKEASPETLAIMNRMDELFMLYPFFGSRQMTIILQREGISIGRHRVRRLMRLMGLQAIYKKPRTSDPHPEHKIYPYLLRKLPIKQANHVWCADITYVPMQKGFLYLLAVIGLKYKLGHPPCAELAPIKHDGCRLLCRSSKRGYRSVRLTKDPKGSAEQQNSTRTKKVSSPVKLLQTSCKMQILEYLWMGGDLPPIYGHLLGEYSCFQFTSFLAFVTREGNIPFSGDSLSCALANSFGVI